MSNNVSFDPVMSRSANPQLVVFQPTRSVTTSVEPVFRYYDGTGQTFYPDPKN